MTPMPGCELSPLLRSNLPYQPRWEDSSCLGNQFSVLVLRRGASLVVLISFVCSRDLRLAVTYRTTEDSLIRFFTLFRSQPSALMEFPGGRHTISTVWCPKSIVDGILDNFTRAAGSRKNFSPIFSIKSQTLLFTASSSC